MPPHIIRLVTLTLAIVVGLAVTPASADPSVSFTSASGHVTSGAISVIKNH
ncbi:MAG: hypothetical protein ABJL99_11110 [Aliishimia sp.]